MQQFEIFWSHIRNFIKKKQLFLIYFFSPLGRAQIQLKDLMSQEKTEQREGTFCQRTQMCCPAQWAAERLLSVGMSLFPGKHCQACSLLPRDTAHEPSLAADSLLARPSGLGLDDTVNFSVDFSTSQGLTSSTWAAEHGTEHCCWRWPDILVFPHLKTNVLAANWYFHRHFSQSISI